MDVKEIADRFKGWVNYAYDAYVNHQSGGEPGRRVFDEVTPHAHHPIRTAYLALMEPMLETEFRYKTAIALLFHDLFEDSTKGLPSDLPPEWADEIGQIVREMTFENGLSQEVKELWSKSPEAILCKLFDKFDSFAESAIWLIKNKPEEGRLFLDHLRRVATYVEREFGRLHTVDLARAMCDRYDVDFPPAASEQENSTGGVQP